MYARHSWEKYARMIWILHGFCKKCGELVECGERVNACYFSITHFINISNTISRFMGLAI
jgi:hypothetical protein